MITMPGWVYYTRISYNSMQFLLTVATFLLCFTCLPSCTDQNKIKKKTMKTGEELAKSDKNFFLEKNSPT